MINEVGCDYNFPALVLKTVKTLVHSFSYTVLYYTVYLWSTTPAAPL